MIRDLLRHLFQPHGPTPDPPAVELSTCEERQRIEARQREISARLERLRIEAEIPAMRRRIYEP